MAKAELMTSKCASRKCNSNAKCTRAYTR